MGNIIKNPYTTDGNWYIGQLHFHTNNSDGTGTPAQMETAYYNAGYHFAITTDHRGASYPAAGDGCTPDPAGTDLLWILGAEQNTTALDTRLGHLGCLGIPTNVQPTWSANQAVQVDIDECRTLGGIASLCHPHYSAANYIPWWPNLPPLKRMSLVEVLNNKTYLIEAVNEWPTGIDLADEYRQIWWCGDDDAHNATTEVDKWCVVVQTGSGTIAQADIISSLDSGNFYIRQTATGPTISSVSVSGQIITVTLPAGSYTVNWYKKGRRLAETDSAVTTTASYTVTGTEGYVFAEINNGTNLAYTQPLFILNDIDLSNAAAASAGTAANLIDNNPATSCDFGAATGDFTIDLGAAKQANGIRIYWNCASTERWNYKVEESTTGAFAGEETEQVRTTFSNRASTTVDVFDVWTRYIKVTITGASVGAENASVKEVEVFNASPEISEYYIDNVSGNNANTGFSIAAAWLTIAYSFPLIRPRDRLNFVNTGTAYTQFFTHDQIGDYALGKHAGAYWYLRGLNFPIVTAAGAIGIRFTDTNNKFIHISGFSCTGGTTGLTVDGGTGHYIGGNKCYSNSINGMLLSGNSTNITFAYNLLYSNTAYAFRDNSAAGMIFYLYNNTAYGNQSGFVIGQVGASVATVRNNISSTNAATEFYNSNSVLTDSNNCNDGTYGGTWAKTNNVDVAPQFVNAAAGDFRLKQTSPLLRKGIAVGLTFDVAGNTVPAWTGKAPDIGAYENRPGGVFIF